MASRAVGRLPASARIRKRGDFRQVQSRAVRVTTPHFVFLLHMPTLAEPRAQARLGITASRKVGDAVRRNRAKRLVREAFRSTRELWQPGLDVVVVVRAGVTRLKLEQVIEEWQQVGPALQKSARKSQRKSAEATSSGGMQS